VRRRHPELTARLKRQNQRLKANPKDPAGLTDRGELRLWMGDLKGAVADFQAVLAGKPPAEPLPRARAGLFDALTELLESDFAAGEPYLKEYVELVRTGR
jgi:hypothetical protein